MRASPLAVRCMLLAARTILLTYLSFLKQLSKPIDEKSAQSMVGDAGKGKLVALGEMLTYLNL